MEKENGFKDFFGDIRRHLMSGISYMLPLIVTFALFMVLGQIPGSTQDVFTQISNLAKKFILVWLSGYHSIELHMKIGYLC